MDMTRQDAWTAEEDMILAETVLRYIRQGHTQLEAFQEVAKKLSRTSAACGFRWNASIRKNYQDAILQAKESRKQAKGNQAITFLNERSEPEEDPLQATIDMLESIRTGNDESFPDREEQYMKRIQRLEQENEELTEQLRRYSEAWEEMGKLWHWVTSGES